MKLYDGGRAPNPRRMRIFLAEKGISIPFEQVDLGSLQQWPAACTAISPLQRVVRDDGAVLTESVAVCRYFEALHLDPPLFGRDARESALIEMWNRRVLYIRVSTVFQHLHSAMKAMVDQQVPASGEANRPRIFDFLCLLDADWHAVVRRRHDLQRCRH